MLYTKNLTMRKLNFSDLKQYYINNQDEQIQRFMPFRYHSDENNAKADLKNYISNYNTNSFPYILAIVKSDIDKLIGHIGIGELDISETEKGFEIEYVINKESRGFHYGAEALKAFSDCCKTKFTIDKIYASVNQQNIASCRSLEKAGFILYQGEFARKKADAYIYIY